ncbi:MAG: sialate O-acetylesterase [Anaerohalosphaeraceae bacterium]
MKIRKSFEWILIAAFLASFSSADVRLPAILSDNMVLQRNTEVAVWGWADPDESITITHTWQPDVQVSQTVKAGPDGTWKIMLKTPDAGGPYTLTIQGKNKITLQNILIGEVWFCSGQSNMEWPTSRIENAAPEIQAAAKYPQIRLFQVDKATAPTPQPDCSGQWKVCSPETVSSFSAIGYLFSRILCDELKVPVGMIGTYWGGTPAEAWTSRDAIGAFPEFEPQVKELDQIKRPVLTGAQIRQLQQEWNEQIIQKEPGLPGQWYSESYDDSSWKTMPVPGLWNQDGLDKLDGIVWNRYTFTLPADWVQKELVLELGPIDDVDITWLNGVKIGQTDFYNIHRRYVIQPGTARAGQNLLAIRIWDHMGGGGLYGRPEQVRIYPKDEPDKAVSLAGEWKYKLSISYNDLPGYMDLRPLDQNLPTVLYNAMIAPLIPYGVRGALWYQGESNCGRGEQYKRLLPAMVQDWRKKWGRGDFPFYYVQIAPYDYGNPDDTASALLREAQFHILSLLSNSGMAVTMDIGNPKDIHPTNKLDVAKRLALWALAKTYGRENLVYSGPLYREMKIEGNKIRLFFDHVGSGLMAKGGPLTHFAIAGEDRKFVPAAAVIEGDTVVVSSPDVPKPVAVRYGFTNSAQPNLFNKEGLPASSFRTDNW